MHPARPKPSNTLQLPTFHRWGGCALGEGTTQDFQVAQGAKKETCELEEWGEGGAAPRSPEASGPVETALYSLSCPPQQSLAHPRKGCRDQLPRLDQLRSAEAAVVRCCPLPAAWGTGQAAGTKKPQERAGLKGCRGLAWYRKRCGQLIGQ